MTSVLSFEQQFQIRTFENASIEDDNLICPRAPILKPISFGANNIAVPI